jgi:hypothetical protein
MAKTTTKLDLPKGRSFPLGATVSDGGANFSLYYLTSYVVYLLFFYFDV